MCLVFCLFHFCNLCNIFNILFVIGAISSTCLVSDVFVHSVQGAICSVIFTCANPYTSFVIIYLYDLLCIHLRLKVVLFLYLAVYSVSYLSSLFSFLHTFSLLRMLYLPLIWYIVLFLVFCLFAYYPISYLCSLFRMLSILHLTWAAVSTLPLSHAYIH